MEATIARPQNNDGLGIALGVSIALHVIIFAVLALRAVFYPTEPIVLEDAIHVDIVALPDKGIKTPPLPPLPEPVKPEPVKPEPEVKEVPKPAPPVKPVVIAQPDTPTVNLNKTKKEEDMALKRLEAMEKIEKMMKEEKPAPAPPRPQPIKGNEISHGNALKGLARLEQQTYLQNVDSAVKSHWNLPAWMTNANLAARAQIFVDANGNVVKKVLLKSSGNATYDERVLAAIDASSPLPPPPADLANIVAVDGIELGFPE
jgi:TonB family protein